VKEKIQKCQQANIQGNGLHKGQTEKLITQKTKLLEELQDGDGILDLENIHKLQQEVSDLLEQDDVKWRQRAKENWLKHGDKNSKYFHACANQRRRANQIEQDSG
jgi:gluconate kinase